MKNLKVLAVIVNYNYEQLNYLKQVASSLKKFKNYNVTVVVNSNIKINLADIDEMNVFMLDNYQLLPSTCRKTIWENRNDYDVFLYTENDHLFLEKHIDRHIEYSNLLPKNRIPGLIQFEENDGKVYFPGYHNDFDWDYQSVETYGGKKFAHFTNLHQASFILTQDQLERVGKAFNFIKLVNEKERFFHKVKRKFAGWLGYKIKRPQVYDVMCKTCTDVYKFGGMKKVICISDFQENLIHHLPNIYIHGEKGRKKLRSPQDRMEKALKRLLSK